MIFFFFFPIIFLFTYIWKKIQYFNYSNRRNMLEGILITPSSRKSCCFTESCTRDVCGRASVLHMRFYILMQCFGLYASLFGASGGRDRRGVCALSGYFMELLPVEKQCMHVWLFSSEWYSNNWAKVEEIKSFRAVFK